MAHEGLKSPRIDSTRRQEKTFDPVAGALETRAEAVRIAAIAFGREVGPCAFLHGELPNPVGVVASVGEQH